MNEKKKKTRNKSQKPDKRRKKTQGKMFRPNGPGPNAEPALGFLLFEGEKEGVMAQSFREREKHSTAGRKSPLSSSLKALSGEGRRRIKDPTLRC